MTSWVTPPTFVSGQVLTAAELAILSNDLNVLHASTERMSVYRNGAFSLTSGSYGIVPFETIIFDPGTNFNTSTFLFTAPVIGYYDVYGVLNMSTTIANNVFSLAIFKNGVEWLQGAAAVGPSGVTLGATVADTLLLNAGDTVAIYNQANGGTPDVGPAANRFTVALRST